MPDQPETGGRGHTDSARARLGAELRRIRQAAGLSQRDLHGPKGSGHASNVENGRTQPSWDLVEKYLPHGGDPRHLRSLYELSRSESEQLKAGQRRRSQRRVHRLAPAPQEIGDLGYREIRRHYVIEARAEHYSLNAEGIVTRMRCECAIRALSPGVVLFCTAHSYDADQRPGVLRIEPAEGCRLDYVDDQVTGSIRAYLRLDRPIDPGEPDPYVCAFTVLVDTSVRTRPVLMSHPGPGTKLFTLDARFSRLRLPRRIWWFAVDNELSATMAEDAYELPARRDGRYRKAFEVIVPGWCYGFVWQW